MSDVRKTRADNLKRLIQEKFDGNFSECARQIDKHVEYIFRYYSPSPTGRRNMSDEMARHIERKLQLSPDWMDQTHQEIGALIYRSDADGAPILDWMDVAEWRVKVPKYKRDPNREKFMCPVPHSDVTFVTRVKGIVNANAAGQQPSFDEGDYIFVDPLMKAAHGNMVVYVDERNRRADFRQLQENGEQRMLRALNHTWPGRIIPLVETMAIVGVVVGRYSRAI